MLKTYIGPFIITFIVGVFILLMQFFWKYIDELVGKGLDILLIAKIMLYAALTSVPLALPIGILLSSLITFGNLGERYELVALKSSGVSLIRIMMPLLIFVTAIAAFSSFFSDYVLPRTNTKFQSLMFDIKQKKLSFNIDEGVYYTGIENYAIKVDKKDKDGKTLYGVLIYSHKNNNPNNSVTYAEKATMSHDNINATLTLTLHNGYTYDDSYSLEKKDMLPFRRMEFERQIITFDMSQFDYSKSDEKMFSSNFKNQNHKEINDRIHRTDSIVTAKSLKINEVYDNIFKADVASGLDTMRCGRTGTMTGKNLLVGIDEATKKAVVRKAVEMAKSDKAQISVLLSTYDFNKSMLTRYKTELEYRFSIAFACIVLFLVGAPLGAIIRKGGLGLPLVVAVVIFVIYYIILTSGQRAALQGKLSPFLGLWIANFIVLPIGMVLTYKSNSI